MHSNYSNSSDWSSVTSGDLMRDTHASRSRSLIADCSVSLHHLQLVRDFCFRSFEQTFAPDTKSNRVRFNNTCGFSGTVFAVRQVNWTRALAIVVPMLSGLVRMYRTRARTENRCEARSIASRLLDSTCSYVRPRCR